MADATGAACARPHCRCRRSVGCQRAIAEKIIDKGAGYLVAVKDYQPTLAQAVESLFEDVQGGVRLKRLKAGWSIDYLQKLLGLHPL